MLQRQQIQNLFQRATADYLCPTLWVEYAEFVSNTAPKADDGNDDDDDDDDDELNVAEGRQIYEQAVMACGQHIVEGRKVWTSYAKFEHSVLQDLEDGEAGQEALGKQHGLIAQLYMRFMSTPLGDLDDGREDVKAWAEEFKVDVDIPALEARYTSAVTMINDVYTPLETALAMVPAPRRDAYESYIAAEVSDKNSRPDRVQLIFERAIVENALDPSLWLAYTAYTDEHLQPLTLGIHARAVRNVPWVAALWSKYALAAERSSTTPHQAVDDLFEQCLGQAAFADAADYLELWMLRCEYMHRRAAAAAVSAGASEAAGERSESEAEAANGGGSAERQAWRRMCERGSAYMVQYFGQEAGDPNAKLLLYQAKLEAGYLANTAVAAGLLEKVLVNGHGKVAAVALQVAELQRAYVSVEAARATFNKVVMLVGDYPDHICTSAVAFEREVGTLDQLDAMVARTSKRMAVVNGRRQQTAAKQAEVEAKQAAKGKGKKRTRKEAGASDSGSSATEGAADAAAGAAQGGSGRTGAPENRAAKRARKHAEAAGVDNEGDAATVPGTRKNDADTDGEKEKPLEIDPSTYPRTAFISNLPFEADEGVLKEALGSCGAIEEVRMNRKGPKRFAYVQFDAAEAVAAALKLDRKEVGGRPMFVSVCVDKKANPNAAGFTFQHKTSLDQCTLFVKNVAFTCTEADLRSMFEPYGTLKDIRMPTTNAGKPKGFAYVEYTEAKAAQKAIMQASGRSLKGRNIFVSLSNPPARQPAAPAPAATSAVNTAFRPRTMARPKAVMPRAQNRKLKMGSLGRDAAAASNNKPISMDDTVAAQVAEAPTAQPAAPKSNSFFSDLFKK